MFYFKHNLRAPNIIEGRKKILFHFLNIYMID